MHDVEPDGLRARERNDGNARIAHQCGADSFAGTSDEVEYILRRARAPENFAHRTRDCGRLFRGLHNHGVAGHECSHGHAAANREREIPRRDHCGNAARLIPLFIEFADEFAQALRCEKFGAFARVVLTEVDCFADIGIRLAPDFARLFHDDR